MTVDPVSTIERAFHASAPAIRNAKSALWPQDSKKGDIHEATYALHVGAELRAAGAYVFVEVPIVSGDGGRLDLLALHAEQRWALAIEFKCLVSAGKDELIAYDVEKLDGLRLRRSSGSVAVAELTCFTALAASAWQTKFATWWRAGAARPPAPPRADRPDAWLAIGRFLAEADQRGRVDAVDLQVDAKYPHWLLYALRREPTPGAFWPQK
jgi:hypothetical protein